MRCERHSRLAPYQAPQVEWHHQQASQKPRLKVALLPHRRPVAKRLKLPSKQSGSAAAFLEKQGHEVVEVGYPVDGQQMMTTYYAMNGGETAAMFAEINAARQEPVRREEMELMTWALYQYGKNCLPPITSLPCSGGISWQKNGRSLFDL